MPTDLESLPARTDDGHVLVVVETPRGSTLKLKWSRTFGAMTLSRPLPAGLSYPCDFGFVPSTQASDGDPLDVLLVWDGASPSGLVVPSRAIGVLELEQQAADGGRERNDRLLALPLKSPRFDHWQEADDVPARVRDELIHFLLASVAFENKQARVLGVTGARVAEELLSRSIR